VEVTAKESTKELRDRDAVVSGGNAGFFSDGLFENDGESMHAALLLALLARSGG